MWKREEQCNMEKGRTTKCGKGKNNVVWKNKNNVMWKREEQHNVIKGRNK